MKNLINPVFYVYMLSITTVFSLSVLGSNPLDAQPTTIQKSTTVSFSITTDFSQEGELKISNLVVSNPRAGMIGNIQVRMEGGDLVVGYDLDTREQGTYQTKLREIRRTDTEMAYIPRPEYVFGEINTSILPEQRRHQFRLINPPDNELVRELSGEVRFALQVDLYSYFTHIGPFGVQVTCNGQSPTFPFFRKSLPHLIGLAVAGGLYFYGESRVRHGKEIYTNDYLTQSTTADAEPFYQLANSANREGTRYKQAAIAVGVTAVSTYLFRQFLHGRRKQLYREKCLNTFK